MSGSLRLNHRVPNILDPVPKTARQVVQDLGLSSSLVLCLDAGDAASYTSGDKWLDRSGNGYDFHRGADATTDGTEPTFVAPPGRLRPSADWTLDGGDYFTYDAANEGWMDDIHQDSALFTLIMVASVPDSASNRRLMATAGLAASTTGFHFSVLDTDVFQFSVRNSGAVYALSMGTPPSGRYVFYFLSVNEAGPVEFGGYNSTITRDTTAYSSPSALGATNVLKIGTRGDVADTVPAGTRIAVVLAFNAALTEAQVNNIRRGLRTRFGNIF